MLANGRISSTSTSLRRRKPVRRRAFAPQSEGMERHGLALVCGFSVVPLCIFLLTVAAGIPMDAPLLWIASSAINIGGALFVIPKDAWQAPDVGLVESIGLIAASILAGVFLFFGLRSLDGGDVFSTVHHCLYVIVMHTIANDASWSVPLYDWISGDTIHYLVHHPTTEFNGLAPLFFEQRLGNAPILAASVAVLGTVGWYLTTVYATVVTGVCIYLSAIEAKARPFAAALAALIFCYAIHVFLGYFVNENLYAVTLVAFLFWACLKKELDTGWLILVGIVCGHLVGVRYTSILFWPAVALALVWRNQNWKKRFLSLGTAGAIAILFILPWLYVNFIMLGEPITHPKIDSEFASRIVTNSIWGYEFEFRALNWPFTDAVYRTAWNPFPSFMWLALWSTLCFGQIAIALSFAGVLRLWKTRRAFVLLLAFAIPHSLAITLLESLDWEQLTYAAPGLVPLGLVLALGIDGLATAA
ncbi:MAG TPA: hypothetical protein EYN66_00575, partial [Myxococcales bacterium]|nr:hypothetical protein [Myxococcales bacterium]